MPEVQSLSLWLTRVLDWPQTIAQSFGPLPGWVFLSIIFLPSLITLATRVWHLVFAVLMLNALLALAAISWSAGEIRTLSIGLASAFILALFGQGLRQRQRDHALADVQARLDQMDERIAVFLQAVDQRAKIVEEQAIELAKNRLRNETTMLPSGPSKV